jgi:hypothetical protein
MVGLIVATPLGVAVSKVGVLVIGWDVLGLEDGLAVGVALLLSDGVNVVGWDVLVGLEDGLAVGLALELIVGVV